MKNIGNIFTLATLVLLLTISPAIAGSHEKMEHGSDLIMTTQHMNIMINHAVVMAAEGSNQIMLGEMGMAPGFDELNIEHGKKTIADAEAMIERIVGGQEMKKIHGRLAGSKDVSAMMYTHELSKAASAYIDKLKKTTSEKPDHGKH